jgi:hypothetical protein
VFQFWAGETEGFAFAAYAIAVVILIGGSPLRPILFLRKLEMMSKGAKGPILNLDATPFF